jgi:hypothetical protein
MPPLTGDTAARPSPNDRARVEHLFDLYEKITVPSPPPQKR